jgi:class 3 adenylate cyclase
MTEKIEMHRFLPLEAFGLMDIEAEDQIASHLKNVVAMAAQAFDFPYAEIIFQSNGSYYRIATVSSSLELNDALGQLHQVVKYNSDGSPFLCKMRRASVIYNQRLHSSKTLLVPDLSRDRTIPLLATVTPIRSYLGSPIMDGMGKLRGVLCLYDTKPRPDIDLARELQIEQFSRLVMQTIENWAFSMAIEGMENRRNRISRQLDKSRPPLGDMTVVVTSIEGYGALCESDPVIMHECKGQHDLSLREICGQHWGSEIEANQGEFIFAFHDPVDAIGFALEVQQVLYDTHWPHDLLSQPEANEVVGAFRGLRISMGIHHGKVHATQSESSDKIYHDRGAVDLASSLASMACGGQILTTFETWDMASYFAGTSFPQAQVLDLGIHVMHIAKSNQNGVDTKHVIQLVPCNLAYDYFAARKLPSEPEEDRHIDMILPGRQFPPLASLKQVGSSFHDAPFENNKVTIAFVNLSAIDDCRVSFVINLIGFLLDCERQFHGYQCEKEMLVFQRPVDAVLFGLRLQEELRHQEPQADGTSLAKLIKYGCMHDSFLTMGPHRTTGRADYFGKTVNRAARLTSFATLGTISFGVVSYAIEKHQENFGLLNHPSINVQFTGKQLFKGIRDEFNIYECSKICALA